MRCTRMAGTIVAVLAVAGWCAAAAPGAKAPLVLRAGQFGPVLAAETRFSLALAITAGGAEPYPCELPSQGEVLTNQATKDKVRVRVSTGGCKTGYHLFSGRPITGVEFGNQGLMTVVAKPKFSIQVHTTLEVCTVKSCKLEEFYCVYTIAKMKGSFGVPSPITNFVASGTGRLAGKESDSRCQKTTAIKSKVTASYQSSPIWAEY